MAEAHQTLLRKIDVINFFPWQNSEPINLGIPTTNRM